MKRLQPGKLQLSKLQWGLLALLLVAISVFFGLDLGRYFSLAELQARQAQLLAFHAAQPGSSALLFFVAYVAVTALSLPGAALMTLLAGALFGLGWGTLLVSFASSLGATLAFLIARLLLHDQVQARFGKRLQTINDGMARDGAFYLFTLRLVPAFPFFLINLLMALTPLRAWTFYWVSQLGILAGTLVYVNAGTRLAEIETLGGILSPALLASFVLLGLFPLLAKKLLALITARRVYAGWQRPARFERNLVVIGAGAAGLVTAYIAAAVKAKVTLVEKQAMGGDCLNTGCVPSKALLHAARLRAQLRRAGEFGLQVDNVDVDFAAVMARVRAVVAQVAPHDSVERYTGLGVEVIKGSARLVTPWEVEITHADGQRQRLTSRSIVIATGARPVVPPLPGLDQVNYLTSDTLWQLETLPRRLVVLGGGPIGCELTLAFARLGAQVTQVEMAPSLLGREDPEVAARVIASFRREGIDLRLQHQALRCEVRKGEQCLIVRDLAAGANASAETALPFDALLLAVGRSANLQGYGLEALGIPAERSITTNEFLQTRYPNIYAAGDVAGPYQFTHTAAHQAWYAAVNALFDPFKKFRADYAVIPWATFVDPEVARVGLNETEAQARQIAYEVSTYGIDDLDRAIADGEAHGFIKVLTVPGSDRILGVTIVGAQAGELIAEYVLAMKQGLGLKRILGTIHIYPTLAEANKYAAGVWQRNHAPQRLLAWVARFHAWRRG